MIMGNNNVIGPISQEDWTTMRDLRGWIKHTTIKDRVRYQKTIEKDTALYREYRDKYCKAA